MQTIENKTFDEERALYGSNGLLVRRCDFDGPADGESAFKECADLQVEDCFFNLRYPFWHVDGLAMTRCHLTENCRAALWYSAGIRITECQLHGIKALRECSDIALQHCSILSPEFGWSAAGVRLESCTAQGEYFMLRARELDIREFDFKGKYSFQYIENAVFENCTLDTKDAFWHAKNVTVRNCTLKGEYLAWYAEGLTLENCRIVGTQPFCYCKELVLTDCEMVDTDLAFERSEVSAALTAPILSIKNPRAGRITVPAAGQVIMDDPLAKGAVELTGAL